MRATRRRAYAAFSSRRGTFLASTLWARGQPSGAAREDGSSSNAVISVVCSLGDLSTRTSILLGWVPCAYHVPEALAVSLARVAGGGAEAASAVVGGGAAEAITLTGLAGPPASA